MSLKNKFAAAVHGHPAKKMQVIFVTGIDGGLETVVCLESILRSAGRKVGVICSQYAHVADKRVKGSEKAGVFDDIYRLQSQLAHMKRAKCDVVIMEIPAEIPHHHFAGVQPAMVVVSRCGDKLLDGANNTVRLDQLAILLGLNPAKVVVNHDDPSYQDFARLLQNDMDVMTFGTQERSELKIVQVQLVAGGCKIKLLVDHHNTMIIDLPLPGKQAVYAALAAIGAGYLMQLPVQAIKEGINQVTRIANQFEPMELPRNYNVVIDGNCSPSGVVDTLESLKHFTKNRVLAVLGPSLNVKAGWYRTIGEQVAKNADRVIVCDGEFAAGQDAAQIRSEIMAGVSAAEATARCEEIADRKEAIGKMLGIARRDDTVVLLSVSRREYRQLGAERTVWDERKVIKDVLGIDA